MTLREYAKQEYPDLIDERCKGGIFGCPIFHDDRKYMLCSKKGTVNDDLCYACWDQEYIEDLKGENE